MSNKRRISLLKLFHSSLACILFLLGRFQNPSPECSIASFLQPRGELKSPTLLEAIHPCSLQDFLGRAALAHPCGLQMRTLGRWFSFVLRKTVGFLVCFGSQWWYYQAASYASQSVLTLGLWLPTLAALDPKGLLDGREGRADGACMWNSTLWRSLTFSCLSSRALQVTSEEEGQWLFFCFIAPFLLHLNTSNVGPLMFNTKWHGKGVLFLEAHH